LPLDGAFLDGLHALSGRKALDRVSNHPDPPRLIKSMSSEDFFWLIKKVGADGSLELLKLATLGQWQYILDVESWQKDRLELNRTGQWIERLLAADPERFTQWLFSDGQELVYYYLYQSIVVKVRNEDEEVFEAGPEFFTIDGFFYIRPVQEDQRETIEALLRTMAQEDTLKYQALLTGVAGVLPAELEEEMYRIRNIRLAEHGFLPREEAIAVYAPLNPESLKTKKQDASPWPTASLEDAGEAPRWPLQAIQGQNLLTKTISTLSDARLLDRIRLEFAGLCNQILSAEGLVNWDMDDLQEIQLQAAGYLNLILKERCHEETDTAENLLRMNTLVSLFRAGFGLALNLKWKAERWLKGCWFHEAGLEPSFWGEAWGQTFYQLLFTLWARQLLALKPGFEALSPEEAKAFLSLLRSGDATPPYRMFGFEERFLRAFAVPDLDSMDSVSKNLKGALTQTWQDFSDEMEFVATDAFDAKYSQYILITLG